MKTEIAEANLKIDKFEKEATEMSKIADKKEIVLKNLSKKFQNTKNDEEEKSEKLMEALTKLEIVNKKAADEDTIVGDLNRRVHLVEEEVWKSEVKVGKAVMNLALESRRADKNQKEVKMLESKLLFSGEQVLELEHEKNNAREYQAEASRSLQDIERKYQTLGVECVKTDEKVQSCERLVDQLEEELETIGENLKLLEVSAEKAVKREDMYLRQIQQVMEKWDQAEVRADTYEKHIKMLHSRMDEVEDDLIRWKSNVMKVSGEIDDTFVDMLGMKRAGTL